jgi:hypothetical protein
MEEKSMTRNHERKTIGRGINWKRNHIEIIIEEASWRSHHGGATIEEGARRNHLGSIWEPSGKHLFGNHLDAFGRLEAEEASGRHLEVRSQKSRHLSAKMQKLHLRSNCTGRL